MTARAVRVVLILRTDTATEMGRICVGCGTEFPYKGRQIRCRPKCGLSVSAHVKAPLATTEKVPEPLTFIAVDGEGESRWGWSKPDGNEYLNPESGLWELRRPEWREAHEYVLLTVGDVALHKEGVPLDHRDIFPFLWERFEENPHAAFVGYFLGYDFTMWLRHIDAGKAWRLLTTEGRKKNQGRSRFRSRPIVVDGKWEVDVIWPKRFALRPHVPWDQIPRDEAGKQLKSVRRPWMYICDTGPYFQQSFLRTIHPKDWGDNPVCSEEEFRRIYMGKAKRGKSLTFGPEMLAYNAQENSILATVMGRLQEGFMADGINLPKDKWYGPGTAAEAWFTLIKAPTGEEFREATPLLARRAARDSYYGGWFEIYAHGVVRGTSYNYDINSAYPNVIQHLPCLRHGRWVRGSGTPTERDSVCLRLVRVRFAGSDPNCGPLPLRLSTGAVCRPLEGIGWYWQDEVEAAQDAGLIDELEYLEWWEFTKLCDCPPPFATIRDLYHSRMAVGKKSPRGKSKKLVYNAAYGKMSQSVGTPKWANVVYASRITSGCRKKILHAIGTHPRGSKDLLMVATDGVVFATLHPLLDRSANDDRVKDGFSLNQHLGEWERTEYQNLALFLPGIYWHEGSREALAFNRRLREEYAGREEEMPELKDAKLHSRGIGPTDLASYVPDIEAQWSEGIKFPSVDVPLGFAFTGAKIAAYRRAWDTCGRVMLDESKAMHAASVDTKRDIRERGLRPFRGAWQSVAWDETADGLETFPYEKTFGDKDLEALDAGLITDAELTELEDTESDYWTPDGPIGSLEGEMLHPE